MRKRRSGKKYSEQNVSAGFVHYSFLPKAANHWQKKMIDGRRVVFVDALLF
jgi:hypothetical protein